MSTKQPSRRRFIQKGAALAGLAATPAALGVAPRSASAQTRVSAVPDMNSMEYVLYGDRSRFITTERVLEDRHHHEAHRPRPTDKTVNDTHGRAACSEWTGVSLSLVLKEAGIKNGASWIVAEGSDAGQHTKSVPMAKVMDDVLVAYGQNGEPVRPDQGFPLRLLVPGFEGIYNVKWLKTIKVVDQPYITFQERSRYMGPDRRSRHFVNELGPKSVITYPSGEDRLLEPGNFTITGLAWSGGGAIRRVEVSVDGGQTWTDAKLRGPALKRAFTRFDLVWRWNGEEAVLQSRCTDELDQVQPSRSREHHPAMEGCRQRDGAQCPGFLVFSPLCCRSRSAFPRRRRSRSALDGPPPLKRSARSIRRSVPKGRSCRPVTEAPLRAPLIFDYVRRAMPYNQAGILSDDESYALTALLLHRNGIIAEDDVMDASSLPRVVMPNRDRYTEPPPDWKPGKPRPWTEQP